jgi:hypothetical protein
MRLIPLARYTGHRFGWRRPGSQVPPPWYFVAQSIHSLVLRLVLARVSGGKVLISSRFVFLVPVKYSFQKEKPRRLALGALLFSSSTIVAD